ncbi:MAG: hypothetical protein WD749_09275 [Phycisphaerales bacterium]
MRSVIRLVVVASLCLAGGCAAPPERVAESPRPEAWSLLGRPLHRPEAGAADRERMEAQLREAEARLADEPASEHAAIWVGRRLAYLGRYQEAIAAFSRGLENHPNSARLLRHRGHRYITVRRLDEAAADLERASRLIAGMADEVEPDGAPNRQNLPRSTLHTNVWYHLGLARYLRGEFEAAAAAWGRCLEASKNDDMKVAASNWLYLSLRRAGRGEEARRVLEGVTRQMDVIENGTYHRLLLMHKGEMRPEELIGATGETAVDDSTVGYGVAMWYLLNEPGRAWEILEGVVSGKAWAAFGYIAAEAELARMEAERARGGR